MLNIFINDLKTRLQTETKMKRTLFRLITNEEVLGIFEPPNQAERTPAQEKLCADKSKRVHAGRRGLKSF